MGDPNSQYSGYYFGYPIQSGQVPSAVGYLTTNDLNAQYQAVAAYAGQRYPAPSVAGTATSYYTDSTFTETGSDAGAVTVYRYREPTSEEARYAPAYVGHAQVQSSLQDQPSNVSTVSSHTVYAHASQSGSSKGKGGFFNKLKKREPITKTWYHPGHPQAQAQTYAVQQQQQQQQQQQEKRKRGGFFGLKLGKDYTEPLIYREK